MIIYKPEQNIFTSTAHFLVNPVNTKGVMGKGLALEMKRLFPLNFKHYHSFCSSSSPKGGDLIFYYPESSSVRERPIINFCTKEDWKKPSKLEWVEKGMIRLFEQLNELYPDSQYPAPLLALPMLGCGEGGLSQSEVLRVITQSLAKIKFDVEIYTSKLSINSESIEGISKPE